jgi:hypothetical protein
MVINRIHERSNNEYAAANFVQKIGFIKRIWDIIGVEAFALVFYYYFYKVFIDRDINADLLGFIAGVAMEYGVIHDFGDGYGQVGNGRTRDSGQIQFTIVLPEISGLSINLSKDLSLY